MIAAIAVAAFLLGITCAIPLSFWVAKGFRFVWAVPAWRFDPASLGDEESASDTWGATR